MTATSQEVDAFVDRLTYATSIDQKIEITRELEKLISSIRDDSEDQTAARRKESLMFVLDAFGERPQSSTLTGTINKTMNLKGDKESPLKTMMSKETTNPSNQLLTVKSTISTVKDVHSNKSDQIVLYNLESQFENAKTLLNTLDSQPEYVDVLELYEMYEGMNAAKSEARSSLTDSKLSEIWIKKIEDEILNNLRPALKAREHDLVCVFGEKVMSYLF
jgi:energy-converting hydrogenase A subunit M